MSTVYDRGRALAIRQLAPIAQGGKGQVVTLTYTLPGAFDEATQTQGQAQTVVQQCSGVEKGIDVRRIDGKSILEGDSEFVLSPVTTTGADLTLPNVLPPRSTLTFADGRVVSAIRCQPKKPSGLLISATLQLRG
ncbi:hypothetical protein [Caulobacter sp. SSI4214]|uniref:hypothetical protein n=1 Tax=Caulobacter sp. SSI4214 TaxID=2575739 RepID=UPI001438F6FB|nr:hypothetical protein [Caulobacter sp. SSI4214]